MRDTSSTSRGGVSPAAAHERRCRDPRGSGRYSWAKPEEGYGAVRAIDPNTGALKWEYKMSDLTWAGILTTATRRAVQRRGRRYFYALDARTGNMLWKTQLGSVIRSGR